MSERTWNYLYDIVEQKPSQQLTGDPYGKIKAFRFKHSLFVKCSHTQLSNSWTASVAHKLEVDDNENTYCPLTYKYVPAHTIHIQRLLFPMYR